MPCLCALLFVTMVSFFLGRDLAVSNAYLITLSIPTLVKMLTSVATVCGLSSWEMPPWPEYSPSEFSRTITQSRSSDLQFARGDVVPGRIRVGRTLTY